MSPVPSRVLLVDEPGWPRDLLAQALAEAGFEIHLLASSDDVEAVLRRTDPDWVFVGTAAGDAASACLRLLHERRRPRVLTLEPREGGSVVYQLHIDEMSLGVLPPAGIAARMAALAGIG